MTSPDKTPTAESLSEPTDPHGAVGVKTEKAPFDDVMLAMDIVDTLRHRALIVEKELATDEREAALIERLQDIYSAQGIEVPEHVLKDGVQALEEKRFVYEPKHRGFQVSLAKLYINRGRWFRPLALVAGVAAFASGIYAFGFDAPKQRAERQSQIELSNTLPSDLSTARDEALSIAASDYARRRIETAYQDGRAAIAAEDIGEARKASDELSALLTDLRKDLTIRVVYQNGQQSGVFRVPDNTPNARNFYLIVEAVDVRGRAQTLEISSEETQSVKRVSKWGVRVPEGEFNRIAADKNDDQIIQNAVIGQKPRGALQPVYAIPTAGGAILEW